MGTMHTLFDPPDPRQTAAVEEAPVVPPLVPAVPPPSAVESPDPRDLLRQGIIATEISLRSDWGSTSPQGAKVQRYMLGF